MNRFIMNPKLKENERSGLFNLNRLTKSSELY